MVETLDEGNQEGSFVEISSPLLAPSLSRDGNSLGGGILLPARAKVVPLSSRTTHATKIYLPLCPFPLYRVSRLHVCAAMYTSPAVLYSIQ